MYQNCCKKCGSVSLHTKVKGNNIGLYCDDCGAWIKWLGKDELRAFEHANESSENSKKEGVAKIIYDNLSYMYCDNCRFNSEINEEDSDEWSCDDCHRKYNGWGISMQTSRRIAKDILESIRE